jgi:putative flippase GtrA
LNVLGPHWLKSLFGWRYLQRLAEARGRRLAKFGTVGAVGVIVNTATLQLLARTLRVPYLLGSVLATQVAILSNYTLSELFVFRAVQPIRAVRVRLAGYVLFNNCSLALTGPLLVLLVSVAGIDLVVANVLSLVTLTLVRFAFADTYLWGQAPAAAGPPERHALWRFER